MDGHPAGPRRPRSRVPAIALILAVPGILAAVTQLPTRTDRPFTALSLPTQADRALLFFGYVDCPHVCPTTLQALRQVHAAYGARHPGAALGVTFVNLTPAEPGVADRYAKAFEPSFDGLQSTESDRGALMRALGVRFERGPNAEGWHTDAVYLLTRRGADWSLRTVVSQRPLDPEHIVELLEDLQP
jgi:cytochrome oxidase Cu insertion factor (SCO1/SenC/PrrC family)